jgi:hypothetical protein
MLHALRQPLLSRARTFSVCGAVATPLSSADVAKYAMPAAVAQRGAASAVSVDVANALGAPATGPVFDCSVCGVVQNMQLFAGDDAVPALQCDVITSWVSPSRGAISQWTADKQAVRVNVRGAAAALAVRAMKRRPTAPVGPPRGGVDDEPDAADRAAVLRDGAVVFVHGRLLLRPNFDAATFAYHYLPELVVSDQYGWARCISVEAVKNLHLAAETRVRD